MGVILQGMVKAVAAAGNGDLEQTAGLTQQIEIAVYGTQADLGVERPDPCIDGIRRGMVIRLLHRFQN